jgi:cytochrome c
MLMRLSTLCAFAFMVSATHATAGDVAAGKDVAERCAMCHKFEKGAGNGIGPNLFGISGRKAASLPDFSYSAQLKESGIVWNDRTLAKWVAGPQKMVPGTKMFFAGITNAKDIGDLIAYLDSLK